MFHCRYGEVHPVFYIGSLDDALRDALLCKARDVSLNLFVESTILLVIYMPIE